MSTRARGYEALALLCGVLLPGAWAAGCGDPGAAPDGGADVTVADADDVPPVIDVPGRDLGGPFVPDATSPAEAIHAADETWAWVPFPDSACGDGSPTGLAVNLTRRSRRVVLFLRGGGACWDGLTCYGTHSADHLDGYDEDVFREDTSWLRLPVFNRADMRNPFRDASFVFVPYCTGDIHTGNRVTTHRWGGRPYVTYHVGYHNLEVFLRRLVPTFPDVDRIWLMGASAGGFGVAMNWEHVQSAFPMARVDVLDDSGPPLSPPGPRWALLRDAWDMHYPPACTGCALSMDALTDYYLARYPAPHRFALLSYVRDLTITAYLGVTQEVFEQSLRGMARTHLDGHANAAYYFLPGQNHVLLTHATTLAAADGTGLMDWLGRFATDDVQWRSVCP